MADQCGDVEWLNVTIGAIPTDVLAPLLVAVAGLAGGVPDTDGTTCSASQVSLSVLSPSTWRRATATPQRKSDGKVHSVMGSALGRARWCGTWHRRYLSLAPSAPSVVEERAPASVSKPGEPIWGLVRRRRVRGLAPSARRFIDFRGHRRVHTGCLRALIPGFRPPGSTVVIQVSNSLDSLPFSIANRGSGLRFCRWSLLELIHDSDGPAASSTPGVARCCRCPRKLGRGLGCVVVVDVDGGGRRDSG
ncbi:hypothetical protein FB382_003658 [Nocardioides ginsengisegetis]|uniref:Uncharacterized protein n=1 Tax=Nocardioides ginsengisegetis TaxID=661491 RepID=A0A7W3J301_9ACTN|nr:hypothetical protein [Nocardioides ginsengisegetis]